MATTSPPHLPPDEQAALCLRAQQGDVAARNFLVSRSIGLVYQQANQWASRDRRITVGDLVTEGVFGLFRAIKKFDPTKGASFATYATPWIKHFIHEAVIADQGLRPSDDRRRWL